MSAFGTKLHLLTPSSIPSSGYASDISTHACLSTVCTSSLFFSDSPNVPCVRHIFSSPTRPLYSSPKCAKGTHKNVLRGCRCQLDGSSPKIHRAPDRGTKTNRHWISTDSECGGKRTLPAFCRPPHRDWFADSAYALQPILTT